MSQYPPPPPYPGPGNPNPYGQPGGPSPYPPQYFQPLPPPPKPGAIPLAPFGLGQVFSGSWQNAVQNFGAAIGLPVLVGLAGYLVLTLAVIAWIMIDASTGWQFFGQLEHLDQANSDEVNAWVMRLIWLISVITIAATFPIIVAGLVGMAGTVAVSSRHAVGLRTTFRQALRFVKPAFGRLLSLSLIVWAVTAVFTVLMFASFAAIMSSIMRMAVNQELGHDPQVGAITAVASLMILWIGSIVLISVLLTFLMARFLFVLPAIVVEGLGPVAALKRSWTLIRGRYWPVFGTYILLSIIVSALGQFVSLVVSFPSAGWDQAMDDPNRTIGGEEAAGYVILQVILLMVQLLVLTALNVYVALAANIMYFDLRFRKEGLHLQLAERTATDPLLQRAVAGDVQALEAFDSYLPGQLSPPESTPAGAGPQQF